jgi:hypothetical protein
MSGYKQRMMNDVQDDALRAGDTPLQAAEKAVAFYDQMNRLGARKRARADEGVIDLTPPPPPPEESQQPPSE